MTLPMNLCMIRQQDQLGERWYIAQMWLTADTTSQVELTDQGRVWDVRLNRYDLS